MNRILKYKEEILVGAFLAGLIVLFVNKSIAQEISWVVLNVFFLFITVIFWSGVYQHHLANKAGLLWEIIEALMVTSALIGILIFTIVNWGAL